MVKANDEAFESAKLAYTLYGWFLQEWAKEVGWEKTLAIQGRIGERLAAVFGQKFRAACSGPKLEGEAIEASLHEGTKHFGTDYEVKQQEGRVLLETHRCPIYEGLSASGLEAAMVEKVCTVGSAREAAALQEAFPELSVSLKFREAPAGPCIEEFVLAR